MTDSTGRIATLGMFCIDQFRYLTANGQDTGRTKEEELGGAGTYFAVGTRTFLPPFEILSILDLKSSTFPTKFFNQLTSYGKEMWEIRERVDGSETTIGRNTYVGEVRDFHFMNPPMRLWPADILSCSPYTSPSPEPLPSIIHFVAAPPQALEIVNQLSSLRHSGKDKEIDWTPQLIYEPFPANCIPSSIPLLKTVTPHLTILSPNHIEALSLVGLIPSSSLTSPAKELDDPTNEEVRRLVEIAAGEMLSWGIKDGGGVVVRAGGMGSCIARSKIPVDSEVQPVDDTSITPSLISKDLDVTMEEGTTTTSYEAEGQTETVINNDNDQQPPEIHWIPAYHQPTPEGKINPKVVDVTGGGNAFLGGLASGMKLCKGDLIEAVFYATVAASYAIEQDGLPLISSRVSSIKNDSSTFQEDLWNGDSAWERVKELKRRCGYGK